jgi:hypothetical protein
MVRHLHRNLRVLSHTVAVSTREGAQPAAAGLQPCPPASALLLQQQHKCADYSQQVHTVAHPEACVHAPEHSGQGESFAHVL